MPEARFEQLSQTVQEIYQRDKRCGPTLEADLTLTYTTPVFSRKLAGFFSFSLPSAYKIVTSNPFGQPLFVVAGDQDHYQAINTLQRRYWAGSLDGFALRNEIPLELINGDWGSWLTARVTRPGSEIEQIREDRQGRGVWLTFPAPDQTAAVGSTAGKVPQVAEGHSHVLLDPQLQTVRRRLEEDNEGEIIAAISYDNYTSVADCGSYQPQEINVTGLQYGAEVSLRLSTTAVSGGKKTYTLPIPAGYMLQIRP